MGEREPRLGQSTPQLQEQIDGRYKEIIYKGDFYNEVDIEGGRQAVLTETCRLVAEGLAQAEKYGYTAWELLDQMLFSASLQAPPHMRGWHLTAIAAGFALQGEREIANSLIESEDLDVEEPAVVYLGMAVFYARAGASAKAFRNVEAAYKATGKTQFSTTIELNLINAVLAAKVGSAAPDEVSPPAPAKRWLLA